MVLFPINGFCYNLNYDRKNMKKIPLLSICIPSYNRPESLLRLLKSIDAKSDLVEIVIAEDQAPQRKKVREQVDLFKKTSPYPVCYFENKDNLGYDANLRSLISLAKGEFVLFMGDDDYFAPEKLDLFLEFLKRNMDVSYILRSYSSIHPDGTSEDFRYLPHEKRFSPGIETCVFFYKRTVTICGVTFKRKRALDFNTNQFDGILLYQLYLVAEIALIDPTVYCDIPVAVMVQSYRDDNPQFGASKSEVGIFQPGKITMQNSINFTKGFFIITRAIDNKYGIDITNPIRHNLSKYSYPFLSIQRKNGRRYFYRYVKLLSKETEINQTWHYYLYAASLWFFGEKICDKIIIYIKRFLGHTPNL